MIGRSPRSDADYISMRHISAPVVRIPYKDSRASLLYNLEVAQGHASEDTSNMKLLHKVTCVMQSRTS